VLASCLLEGTAYFSLSAVVVAVAPLFLWTPTSHRWPDEGSLSAHFYRVQSLKIEPTAFIPEYWRHEDNHGDNYLKLYSILPLCLTMSASNASF